MTSPTTLLSMTIGLCSLLSAADSPLQHTTLPKDQPGTTLTRFAFGSCWKHNRSQAHWKTIADNAPQLWLWLGDNIYADTDNIKELKQKYQQLASTPGYLSLAKNTPVIATWDDHDYGKNDAGRDFTARAQSQRVMLDFFNEPMDSIRRKSPGVYTSYYLGKKSQRVQIILLDTRYFRSPLKPVDSKPAYRRMGWWSVNHSKQSTMLGDQQWSWLEQELMKPAQFRIIASSIQFAAPHNGYEAWANMPLERQRMIDLIKKTHAEGVVFLSGDIHSSELCLEEAPGCYPLLDHTSSSLNAPLGAAPTRRRLGPAYGGANFGLVTIDWTPRSHPTDPIISFTTKDEHNVTRLHHSVRRSQLTFAPQNLRSKTNSSNFAGVWQTSFGPMSLSEQSPGSFILSHAKRKGQLQLKDSQLIGTWASHDKSQSGKVNFRLTRDGQFLKGSYSYGELPLQLDWAGWKATWEYHFQLKK